MRHKLLIAISILFVSALSFAQDTIPNHSFENWATNYNPQNWETTNLLLPLGINNCSQSTNSFTGNYALFLESIDLDGQIVPGVATIGTLDFYTTTGGIPYSDKPVALKGFFQHPSFGDEILIGVEFFKDGIGIGGGVFTTTDSISEYTEFVIPLSYNPGLNPDTLNITILTDPYKAGSTLLIDGLEMEFQTTGTQVPEIENHISCYPNPSDGKINFDLGAYNNSEIQIYNSNGKLIQELHTTSNEMIIDLSNSKPGLYLGMVRQGNTIMKEKIIVK